MNRSVKSWKRAHNGPPLVMGILNLTPDSFSDGGSFNSPDLALKHVFEMVDAGANIIDIGGESTRPGSDPVSGEDELERVMPILSEILPSLDIPVSIDTYKPEVAEAAVDVGVSIVNDINGLRNPKMMKYVVQAGVPAVIMHMHGKPNTLATDEMTGDILATITDFYNERLSSALDAGMKKENIILDPGLGFGKTPEQNIEIVENTSFYKGYPILTGSSRKRFLAVMYPGMDKDLASAEAAYRSWEKGADIVRVHNVSAFMDRFCNGLENI